MAIEHTQLYKLRKRWLEMRLKGLPFELHASREQKKRSFTPEVQDFLHKALSYIKEEAYYYRNRINFAYLSEKVQKEFNVLYGYVIFRQAMEAVMGACEEAFA